jgi:hypothetical protein
METTTETRRRQVFEAVQNPEHWKLPVSATIPQSFATEAEIRDAVAYFTGSVAIITADEVIVSPHPSALVRMLVPAWRVEAVGYYAAVGA